jgi:type IV pilus assembly protein PilB
VTGPTGSGKTTTLYAVLKHLNRPNVNILTIEDPIEYRLKGISQVQVNTDAGLDFSAGLRAFLRQDPDIILVGEIRDFESARIASQAALTGHLVMTTMHTNGAVQSVTRLVDIGVEPFLVAPSIIGVLFQRLVRTICAHCKEPYQLTPEQITDLFEWDGKTPVTFYRGKGCPECNNTGYRGRTGVHEMLILNNTIRRLISRDASLMEIQDEAFRAGFRTIRHDGLKKVLRGITTIEEVDRITATPE